MVKNIMLNGLNVGDQIFEGGTVKTATINLSNNSLVDREYSVELYLSTNESGVVKDASSGLGVIVIPSGDTVAVQFTLTLPEDGGEYFVFLDIVSEGGSPITHKAPNRIVVLPSSEVAVSFVQWQ